MTNLSCSLCGGKTGYDYAGDKFTTVTRNHFIINGEVICSVCIDDIKNRCFTIRNKKITLLPFSFSRGDHINHV